MKQIDLDPSEYSGETKPKASIFQQMRQASRDYESPPISLGTILGILAVVTATYLARNGWPH
jgi:hypothetical protein